MGPSTKSRRKNFDQTFQYRRLVKHGVARGPSEKSIWRRIERTKLAYQQRVLTVTSKAYRFTSNPFRLQPEVVESSGRNLGDIKVGCNRGDSLFSVSKIDLSVTVEISMRALHPCRFCTARSTGNVITMVVIAARCRS